MKDIDTKNSKEFEVNFINELTKHHGTVHLAIFIEPFLTYVLNGKKKWESRFSINKCAPYQSVNKGDCILIKKSGGPIVAIGEVSDVWYFHLDKKSFAEIKKNYSDLLCIEDPIFWETKKFAEYATIINLKNIKKIEPININKKDRRGWLIISKNKNQFELSFKG